MDISKKLKETLFIPSLFHRNINEDVLHFLLVNLESYFKYKDTFKFPLLFYNKKDYFNILVALSGSKICWSKIAKPL